MADAKVSGLAALAALADDDEFLVVDKSDTSMAASGTSKRVTRAVVDAGLNAHIADTTDAHDASAISFVPTGSIAATDVQAAIVEVRDEASGAAYTRTTATYTTASLDGGEDEVGTVTLAISYRLIRVATSRPARVRLHTTAAKRDVDRSRPSTTDPAGDHGVVAEVITTAAVLSVDLPQVIGSSLETVPAAAIPITVDNRDSVTGTVVVTFTWQREE